MRLVDPLRLSTYLTVALATAGLTFAEWPYLAEMPFLIGPVATLLVLAYWKEDRWQLTATAANGLGLIIAAGWTGWIFFSFSQAPDTVAASPWTVKLLPYIGPMLMVLLLVKLYRPKQSSDYWYIQSIGLMEVALGCVLSGEPLFGVFFFAYLASAWWFLMIFHIYREQAVVSSQYLRSRAPLGNARRRSSASHRDASMNPNWFSIPILAKPSFAEVRSQAELGNEGTNNDQQVHEAEKGPSLATSNCKLATALPWRYLGILQAGRWLATTSVVGFLLFLLIPQHGDAQSIAEILSGQVPRQVGFSANEVDLNQTGPVEIDDRLAFEVFAENADGSPKLDLSPMQRWRGVVMERYDSGRWVLAYQLMFFLQRRPQQTLPDLGPSQYFLTLHLDTRQSHGLFLADPVVLPKSSLEPYLSLTYEDKPLSGMGLFQRREGCLFPVSLPRPAKMTYRQVTLPALGDGIGPGNLFPYEELGVTLRLLQQPVPGIRKWTNEVLRQLVVEGKLAREDIQTKPVLASGFRWEVLPPEKRIRVAKALDDFLTSSGEYSYSLDWRREDMDLDPTEDFLRNVKEGHCERFATGLALMLRSAGVPCRLVKGFRGAEMRDSSGQGDGWYVVRHSHAHAWVEALVGGADDKKLYWLTLDPSPGAEEQPSGPSLSLWGELSWFWLRNLWRNFVLEYNTDQQRDTAQALWNRSGPLRHFAGRQGPYILAGGVALLAGFVGWQRMKPRRKRAGPRLSAELAFYGRLQKVLARHFHLILQPGQTPQEYAACAQQLLRATANIAWLADTPLQVVQLYYRARYGQMPLTPAEQRAIDGQIDELARSRSNDRLSGS